jgi:hypothetical protein
VQPYLGIDQHFLGDGDPVGHQLCFEGDLALNYAERDRGELVVRALGPTKSAGKSPVVRGRRRAPAASSASRLRSRVSRRGGLLGCARAERSPGRASSPCPGARPGPIQPALSGMVRRSVSCPSRGSPRGGKERRFPVWQAVAAWRTNHRRPAAENPLAMGLAIFTCCPPAVVRGLPLPC